MIESLVSYTGYYVKTSTCPTQKWYEHTPQPVTESTEVTILWNFTINTDRKIEANQPDITIKNSEENTYITIDVTVPADKNISLKEFQKLSKYKDLEIEVTKMWKLKTNTGITALGMIKKGTQNSIDKIPGKPLLQEMQKIVFPKYCSHITKIALNVSKHSAISNNIITNKYSPPPSSEACPSSST